MSINKRAILSIVKSHNYINNLNKDGVLFVNSFDNTSEETIVRSLNYANKYRLFIDKIINNIIKNNPGPIYYEYLFNYIENELKLKINREISNSFACQIGIMKNNSTNPLSYYDNNQQITRDGIYSIVYETHCNGYMIDSIHNISFDQLYTELITAAETALNSTIQLMAPGKLFVNLSRNNEKIIADYRKKHKYNVFLHKKSGGTLLERYTPLGDNETIIYAGIPKDIDPSYFTKRLKPHKFYTIGIRVSNVDINDIEPVKITEINGGNLCSLLNDNISQNTYNNLSSVNKRIYNLIKSNFNMFIFSIKKLSDIANLTINETINILKELKGIVYIYTGGLYPNNVRLAYIGCTVYITNTGAIVYN